MAKRGRPKGSLGKKKDKVSAAKSVKPTEYSVDDIFTRTFFRNGKPSSIWTYRKSDSLLLSVEDVEVIDPNYVVDTAGDNMMANKDLPKTKRKYLNPINGKYVGYTRAKMLGLAK